MPDLSNPLECIEAHVESMRFIAKQRHDEARTTTAVARSIEGQADDLEMLLRSMERYAPENDRDEDRTEAFVSMLGRCREQFLFYEQAHRAKGTPEGDLKAAVNAGYAEDIRALLEPPQETRDG